MSFYYKPEWCLYAASEVERNQAAKKRFVDEYESNVCYRKEAKNLLNDKIMGLTEVVPSRRADTVKVVAVMSYLLFNENKPKWTKLVQLLGRDFSYMPRMVSAMYAGTKAAYDFTDEINKPENVAKRYLFFLYGYASPESQLPQNKDVYDIWTRNLANSEGEDSAIQREFFAKLGTGVQKTISDLQNKVIADMNKKLVDAGACVERAENKAADADKLLQQSKKRENALTSKLETAYAEIDELMQLVPEETEDDLPDEQEALEEETLQPDDEPDVDYGKKLDELLQKYSVAVVGGNQNLMKRFQVLHPDAIYVSKDMVAACDQMIHAADLVLCKVDSMSHALYNKCKVTCHRYDIQMNYLPNVTSCTRLEKCMCEMIEALSA